MAFFFRSFVVCALISALVSFPAMAAEQPIGVVLVSQLGYVDKTPAAVGADLYPGEAIHTDPGGTLRFKSGLTQLYLLSASAATVMKENGNPRVRLSAGALGFSTVADQHLEIQTPVATVRSAGPERAFAQVSITDPNTIRVSAFTGSVAVAGYGDERIVKAGETYDVRLSPDPQQDSNPAPPQLPYKSYHHLIFTIVLVGVSAAAGAVLYHNLQESDSTPQ